MYVGGNIVEEKEDNKKELCFVIMPISDQGDYPKGHFTKVYEQIFQPAIEAAGYEPYRVDDDKMCDSIIKKIFDAVYTCPMALCDLSNRNPNVLYELGLRQAYDKPVVLVQDDKTERIFDVSGINTVSYKSNRLYENILEARERITEAIISTKEGRETSIVKMWQAVAADVSHDSMSKEDKLEIMIRSIMSDIQDLKAKKTSEENTQSDFFILNNDRHNIIANGPISVTLKWGVTNKEIRSVVERIKTQYDPSINYYMENGNMYVDLNADRTETMTGCLMELSKLGKIYV